jgi:hypothetical protein
MPFNTVQRVNTVDKEILKFPAGLDAIKSIVVSASGLDELPSATVGRTGVYGLLAGTILKKIGGDPQGRYEEFTGSGTIEGILGEHIFVYPDNVNDKSDAQVDMLFHGVVFDRTKIVDYATHAAALATDHGRNSAPTSSLSTRYIADWP